MMADEDVIAWWFTALTVTGPISGVIVGGVVISFLGGFEDKRA
jgi:hypothetical protein